MYYFAFLLSFWTSNYFFCLTFQSCFVEAEIQKGHLIYALYFTIITRLWSTTESWCKVIIFWDTFNGKQHSLTSHAFLNIYTNTFPLQAFISGLTLPFSTKTNQVNRQWETYREERKEKKKSQASLAKISPLIPFPSTQPHKYFCRHKEWPKLLLNHLNLMSDYNDTAFAVQA